MNEVIRRPEVFFRNENTTDVWLTPKPILDALGPFDLDPCAAPEPRPWPTASTHYVEAQDGLSLPWNGRVWLNPPYGRAAPKWLERLAEHGNGIALVFARVETAMFFKSIWPAADAVLFPNKRISFLGPDGKRKDGPAHNASAPSCLIAYGQENVEALRRSGIEGVLLDLSTAHMVAAE